MLLVNISSTDGQQMRSTSDRKPQQKKNGRQVISSQITKDLASARSALGFVPGLRVDRRGRSKQSRPEPSE